MLGEATTAAWRSAVACLFSGVAAAMLILFPSPASADPPEPYGWREVWAGVDASSHVWLAYSGATVAPYSDMFSNGLRLRAAAGYGEYTYTGERNAQEQSFSARTGFVDALVGYLERFGPLTAKAFVGVAAVEHDVTPFDPQNPVQGRAYGPKGVVELWLNMGDSAWSSLDAAWTSAHETYAGRLRSGYRLFDDVSVGLEARVDGNELDKEARGGMFVRYAWHGGEISLAGGVAGRFFEDANNMHDPYATLCWLMQY
jgi:hypothetical protein